MNAPCLPKAVFSDYPECKYRREWKAVAAPAAAKSVAAAAEGGSWRYPTPKRAAAPPHIGTPFAVRRIGAECLGPHFHHAQKLLHPLLTFLADFLEPSGLFIRFWIFGSLVQNQEIQIGCVVIGIDFQGFLQVASRTGIVRMGPTLARSQIPIFGTSME